MDNNKMKLEDLDSCYICKHLSRSNTCKNHKGATNRTHVDIPSPDLYVCSNYEYLGGYMSKIKYILLIAGIFLFITCTLSMSSDLQKAVQTVSNNISEANYLQKSTIHISKDLKPNIAYSISLNSKDILVTYGMINLVDNQDQLAFELAGIYAITTNKTCSLQATKKDLCFDLVALQYMIIAGYDPAEGIKILGKLIDITDHDPNVIKRYLFLQAYIRNLK